MCHMCSTAPTFIHSLSIVFPRPAVEQRQSRRAKCIGAVVEQRTRWRATGLLIAWLSSPRRLKARSPLCFRRASRGSRVKEEHAPLKERREEVRTEQSDKLSSFHLLGERVVALIVFFPWFTPVSTTFLRPRSPSAFSLRLHLRHSRCPR